MAKAAPDVLQQVRLLVEQCRVLDSGGQLLVAKKLDSVELNYPDAPIGVLFALHRQYPAAGPRLECYTLEQFDEGASAWQRETDEMKRNAVVLEQARNGGGGSDGDSRARS